MRKKVSYRDEYGDMFVEYIPKKIYEQLDESVIQDINMFRHYSRFRKSQEDGIKRVEKKMEPLKRELKKRKEKLQYHKSQQKFYFNKIGYLKKRYTPIISIYEKDESSKSYKSSLENRTFYHMKITHGGKKLGKRITLYCQIKLPSEESRLEYSDSFDREIGRVYYHQSNIYLGSYDTVKELVGGILGEDLSGVQKNTLFRKTQSIFIPYIQSHIQNGYEEFTKTSHPFQGKIIPWCKKNLKGDE